MTAVLTTRTPPPVVRRTVPDPVLPVCCVNSFFLLFRMGGATTTTTQVPVFGLKNSLNVASAGTVVLYEVLRQWSLAGRLAGNGNGSI